VREKGENSKVGERETPRGVARKWRLDTEIEIRRKETRLRGKKKS